MNTEFNRLNASTGDFFIQDRIDVFISIAWQMFSVFSAFFHSYFKVEVSIFYLQRNDIAMAITKYDQFDFLIDIVPRDDIKPNKIRDDGARAISNPDQVTNK